MNSFKKINQIIALTLAVVVLTTSVGFTIDMHFCRGKLQAISFFGKAKPCHDIPHLELMKKCVHYKKMVKKNGHCAMNEKDNCTNKTLRFQLEQDQQIEEFNIETSKPFIIAYLQVFFLNHHHFDINLPAFAHYKPPLISKDILVLVQSFLL